MELGPSFSRSKTTDEPQYWDCYEKHQRSFAHSVSRPVQLIETASTSNCQTNNKRLVSPGGQSFLSGSSPLLLSRQLSGVHPEFSKMRESSIVPWNGNPPASWRSYGCFCARGWRLWLPTPADSLAIQKWLSHLGLSTTVDPRHVDK